MSAADRARHAQAVSEILDFMRYRHLVLADLTEYGGEDLPNPKLPGRVCNPARVKNARAVERCWELMARLSVKFADLEAAPQPIPDKPVRSRRGEGGASKTPAFSTTCEKTPLQAKSNKINNLANSAPVGPSDSKTEVAR